MNGEANDPTKNGKATFPNLGTLAKAYPRCHKMWHYLHPIYGEIYGLRNCFGYDWWCCDKKLNRWVYLTKTWDKVPTYVVKTKAYCFDINRPWLRYR